MVCALRASKFEGLPEGKLLVGLEVVATLVPQRGVSAFVCGVVVQTLPSLVGRPLSLCRVFVVKLAALRSGLQGACREAMAMLPPGQKEVRALPLSSWNHA